MHYELKMEKIKEFVNSKYSPVLYIILIWVLFSLPYFLNGKILFPSDYLSANFSPWSAYPEYFSAVKNDSMPDIITQIYPWKFFAIDIYKNFQIPLWNPYSFSGTPFLANYQSAAFSPLNLGFFIFPFIEWWGILILLQPLCAGIFTYIYARSMKLSKVGGLIASLSFMFCGFVTSWMAYGTLVFAILYLPLALFAIEKYMVLKKTRYLLLLAITIPLSFFSGHFQISLYFLLFVIFYLLFKYLQTRNVLATCHLLLATGFGLLIAALQLFPSIELYSQSFRSTIFQKIEVIPWEYTATLFAPDFFGNPVTRNAWFGHYAEWNMYIGVVGLFFAVYALSRIKKSFILFFSITATIALLCALPSPLLDLLVFSKIPVLSTSALSRIIVLFSFSCAILAGFGIELFLENLRHKRKQATVIVSAFFLVVAVVLWLIVLIKSFMSSEHAQIALSNLRFPTLILLLLGVLIIISYALRLKKKLVLLSVLVVILLSVDVLRFSLKWVPFEPKSLVYPHAPVTKAYKDISGSSRVFGNFGAEDSVYYKLPSAEGYDAIYIRRYGQFISYLDRGVLSDSERSGVELPLQGKYMIPAANFLGFKYFVHKVSDGQNVWEFPFWKYDPKSLKLIYDDKKFQILQNTNAFPRAFLVSNIIVEKDSQKMLDKMFNVNTNLKKSAFLEEGLKMTLSSGSAQISTYTPNKISIKTIADGPSFLVLTDVFYPGWKVYINGKSEKLYRTDFAFRGVFIPKGKSTIVFSYEPDSFRYGVIAAILGSIGICTLCFVTRKQKK